MDMCSFQYAGETPVTLQPLENPEDPRFERFLNVHAPFSLRIRGALAEGSDGHAIWTDGLEDLHVAIHRGRGWLAPVGAQDDIIASLDEFERMAAEMEEAGENPNHPKVKNEKGVLRMSAIPASVRDAISEKRDFERETGCGLYTLTKEDLTPDTEGPPIGRIREEEYEFVTGLAQYGEGASYLSERLSHAPHAAVRVEGELAAYMIVHANGSIGMLHTVEKFRNRGLGRHVASALAEMQFARGMLVYCYIVDGNTPSQRVFTSLGFRRVADVSWCVFKRGER
jgi:RimJ/RimL family protein N-acetyltransferase